MGQGCCCFGELVRRVLTIRVGILTAFRGAGWFGCRNRLVFGHHGCGSTRYGATAQPRSDRVAVKNQ